MKISDIGEFGWIERIRGKVYPQKSSVLSGIGDDSAWIKALNSTLITTDLLIEGVHFLREAHPPRFLGRKALSVNISDISAMAGIPEYALLSIGFPKDTELEYGDELIEGFLEVAQENKVELIGGDTTASDKLIISVMVLGRPAFEKPVLRSGAKPGDEIWVSGNIGDASLGFELLKKSRAQKINLSDLHLSSLLVRHFDPSPRVSAGIALGRIANSMIDISDGIMLDLKHILEESGREKPLRGIIHLDKIPLSKEFRDYFGDKPLASTEALSLILSGGEDYELLFSAGADAEQEIRNIERELDLKMSKVGKIESAESPELIILDQDGNKIAPPPLRFEHFPQKDKKTDEP